MTKGGSAKCDIVCVLKAVNGQSTERVAQSSNLMLILGLLRHKHLLQFEVQAFNATSEPRGQSVQGNQGQCLWKEHVNQN